MAGAVAEELVYPPHVNEEMPSELRRRLSLDGTWELRFDPDSAGEEGGWHGDAEVRFPERYQVPGCYEAQDPGMTHRPILKTQPPDWARNLVDIPYGGRSWVRRSFVVPDSFAEPRVHLNFGAVSQKCRVWLNGIPLGRSPFAGIAFGFDVSRAIRAPGENSLVLEIENRLFDPAKPDLNETDAVGLGVLTSALNWQGVWRSVEVVAVGSSWIRDVHAFVSGQDGSVAFEVDVQMADQPAGAALRVVDLERPGVPLARADIGGTGVHVLRCSGAAFGRWEVREPRLHRLRVSLEVGGVAVDSVLRTFGYRTLAFADGRFCLNGRPAYLRGDMYHTHWPLTVSTPVDRVGGSLRLRTGSLAGAHSVWDRNCSGLRE